MRQTLASVTFVFSYTTAEMTTGSGDIMCNYVEQLWALVGTFPISLYVKKISAILRIL